MTATTETPVTSPIGHAVQEMFSSIVALTAALNRSSDISERLLAGQQAALDKVDAPKATRTRKAKEETTPSAAEEAKAEPVAEKAVEEKPAIPAAKEPATPSMSTGEEVKKFALEWINEQPKGSDGRKERGDFVLAVQNHLGTKLGELTDADEMKQAVFFIERKKAGHDVDFSAEYDFDGALDQEVVSEDDEYG